jgi:hypothetical protein
MDMKFYGMMLIYDMVWEYNIRGLYKKINNKPFVISNEWLKEIETSNRYIINSDNLK